MDTAIVRDHQGERKQADGIDRLRGILGDLCDEHRATVWEHVALNLAAQQHGSEE